MATALFINRTDLVKNTIINGNVDTDTFLQFVNLAQIQHLQIYLGTALYDQISNAILANTISADLDDLLKNYLQPMLIHFSMVDYLPFSSFTISQGGLQKHSSENAQQATKDEVDFLVQKHRNFAEFYTRRFIKMKKEYIIKAVNLNKLINYVLKKETVKKVKSNGKRNIR